MVEKHINSDSPRFVSVSYIRECLGVSRASAYEMVAEGGPIPAIRTGTTGKTIRVRAEDFEAYLASRGMASKSQPEPRARFKHIAKPKAKRGRAKAGAK